MLFEDIHVLLRRNLKKVDLEKRQEYLLKKNGFFNKEVLGNL